MIKKWSYVAAIMLTAASGLALTSCIDNDEPYGIEQIRLATANLLNAKKSALEAQQAIDQAQIELAKLEIEIKKAEAETAKFKAEQEAKIAEINALAAKAEAEARAEVDKAKAEILKAKAEKLKEEAANIKAQTEAYVAEKQEELKKTIAQNQIDIEEAQNKLDKAKYDFEKEKNKDNAIANKRLYDAWEKAFEAYFKQLDLVNWYNLAYLNALQKYNEAAVDLKLVVDEKGDPKLDSNGKYQWESKHYDALASLKKAVANAQKKIDNANKDIDNYKEIITNLENITSTDLYKKFADYEEAAKANDAELAQAAAEKAALPIENKELYQAILDLESQISSLSSKPIEIPAYTWDPKEIDEAAFASIGITEPVVIVEPRTYYALASTESGAYTVAVDNYNDLINKLTNYLLDANDVAWTQARINELNNLLKQQQPAFEEAKTNWENAKKAYKNGNDPDYSVIPMEADVEAAVAAFNASSKEYTDLRESYLLAQDKYNEANKKAEELAQAFKDDPNSAANKLEAARQAHLDALQANEDACDQAKAAADEAYQKVVDTQQNKIKSLKLEEKAKLDLYNEALSYYGDEDNENVKNAYTAYTSAQEATRQALIDKGTAVTNAQKAQKEAYFKATNAKINADLKADQAWEKAQQDYNIAEEKDPAAKDWYAAVKEANEAEAKMLEIEEEYYALDPDPNSEVRNPVWNKYDELYNACFDQWDAVGGGNWDYETSLNILFSKLYGFLTESDENLEFPVAEAPSHDFDKEEGGYVNVKAYLVNMSAIAYGLIGEDYDKNNGINEFDEAFLIDAAEITPAMINEYIKAKFPNDDEFDYWVNYKLFGAYGATLYTQNRIDVATAMINNQELLSESIEPLKEGLAALEESYVNAENEVKELGYALEDKEAEKAALEEEIDAKVENLKHWQLEYDLLLAHLSSIIAAVEENSIPEDADLSKYPLISNLIEETVKDYEEKIEDLQKKIDGVYKDRLDRAEYQLQQYTDNEGVMTANPEEGNLAFAEGELSAAKEKCALLKAIADELEAKYKAATSNQ